MTLESIKPLFRNISIATALRAQQAIKYLKDKGASAWVWGRRHFCTLKHTLANLMFFLTSKGEEEEEEEEEDDEEEEDEEEEEEEEKEEKTTIGAHRHTEHGLNHGVVYVRNSMGSDGNRLLVILSVLLRNIIWADFHQSLNFTMSLCKYLCRISPESFQKYGEVRHKFNCHHNSCVNIICSHFHETPISTVPCHKEPRH
jgi:ABC-type Zn2+ transport system substrate-binding protein/surface adhesin